MLPAGSTANRRRVTVKVTSDGAGEMLVLQVSGPALDVPRLFEVVEAAHTALGGTAYSIAQMSLEQVFLKIARGADDDRHQDSDAADAAPEMD